MPVTSPRPAQARRRTLLAALLAVLLVGGLVPLAAAPASAAPGDYTVSLEAPATIPYKQSYSYSVTLEVDATPAAPAAGIVLRAQLPAGVAFREVPTGGDSPVESAQYDAGTRVVTFTLRPVGEQLLNFSFAVAQVDNHRKYLGMRLTATLTGSATPSGSVPTDSATTTVTGDNVWDNNKLMSVLPGTGNRIVTYTFAFATNRSFEAWGARLTDVLPAGVVVRSATSGWTFTGLPDGSTSAVWQPYDLGGTVVGPAGLSLTVEYPASAFPAGTTPPRNTVDLSIQDASGDWYPQRQGSAQPPQVSDVDAASGASIVVVKGNAAGADHAGYWNSYLDFTTTATFVDPNFSGDRLESLTVEDSSTFSAGNAETFDHADVRYLRLSFNSTLAAANLPYTLQYTTNAAPGTWLDYTPPNATTGRSREIVVQPVGSRYGSATEINLPVGERLTGWRVIISPDAATTIPAFSQVQVITSSAGVYLSAATGLPPQGEWVNTATASGSTVAGVDLQGQDPLRMTMTDALLPFTRVSAPPSIAVGEAATYTAQIANVDPSGRDYDDSYLRVVLPVGVYYDPSVGVAATSTQTDFGIPVPQIGDGVTETTETVTDAAGEHQVVVLRFDTLASVRSVGQPSAVAPESGAAFAYTIPTLVQPAAMTADNSPAIVTSWVHTQDPDLAGVPLSGRPSDRYDFDPARSVIEQFSASSIVTSAGGLLMGKLVRASSADAWSVVSTVDSPGEAEWQVSVRNVLPRPVTDIVLFDRVPFAGDDRGSEFSSTLAGPVTGLPAGATVEYSADAVDATSGTWSTDPAGATAFRVTLPELATGESLSFVFPTSVPSGVTAGAMASNVATATGVFDGSERSFFSTEASITPRAMPSMTLVKRTNGLDVDAAPGPLVASGSDVTWSYLVTNTGNAFLDAIELTDAFTAGDGSTGSFIATSDESGPLAPGDSRTFTATGVAVPGQYENTATGRAVAVDPRGVRLPVQPEPASDSSWYVAGDAGLSIVKTTNGEEVSAAPGPMVDPGSDVEWAYTVRNTGSLDLTDVLVVDVDAEGTEVFRDTIASLPAGDSVTLTAQGVAIAGGYANTVVATAENPIDGADPLRAEDTSWYFGITSGITLEKTVGAAETGPFGESVTIEPGGPVWWRFVVTNPGNVPLRDVVIRDEQIGESVQVGDLAAGASATFVVQQASVTSPMTNVATVDGVDPRAGVVTATDDAAVDVRAVPTPTPGDPANPGPGPGPSPGPSAGPGQPAPSEPGGEASPSPGEEQSAPGELPRTGTAPGLVVLLLGGALAGLGVLLAARPWRGRRAR